MCSYFINTTIYQDYILKIETEDAVPVNVTNLPIMINSCMFIPFLSENIPCRLHYV